MSDLAQYKFYLTKATPCGYLPGLQASTLLFDPQQEVDAELFMRLCELGFRRSGGQFYRPHCKTCNACLAARVVVADFVPNRQQKRNLKRNADLAMQVVEPKFTDEYYSLYVRYITQRHADGDMYPPDVEQFSRFLLHALPFSRFFEFRKDGRLLAVAVTDVLPRGLTAVYTFYEPEEEARSLGRYAILSQIRQCQRLGLKAVYLGYWISPCQKMNYKTEYRPIELMVHNQWFPYGGGTR